MTGGIDLVVLRQLVALLVPAMAGLVIMWALALLQDAGYVAPAHSTGHA